MTSRYEDRRFRYTNQTYSLVSVPGEPDSVSQDAQTNYLPLVKYTYGGDLYAWRRVIAEGGNALNLLDGLTQKVKISKSSGEITTSNYGTDLEGNKRLLSRAVSRSSGLFMNVGYSVYPGAVPEYVWNAARSRFVSTCRNRQTQVAGGVILLELRKTIHGIRHPALALRRGLSSYLKAVKRQSKGLRNASAGTKRRAVAGTWLEYTFGWKPLISDIEGSARALSTLVNKFRPQIRVSGRGNGDEQLADTEDGLSTYWGQYSYRVMVKDKWKVSFYGALRPEVATDAPTFRGSFGLRAHDFVPTVWELIPFSFVTDYFSNVGEILSAACYSSANLAWWGATSIAERKAFSYDVHETSHPEGSEYTTVSGSSSPGSFEAEAKVIRRDNHPSFVPSLSFQVPGLRQGFNLAALFAQASAVSRSLR